MFNLPVKEIIVNSDAQVVLREDDGTAYADNDIVADTTGGFILDGFINEVLWGSLTASSTAGGYKNSYLRFATGSDMMIKTTTSAGVAEIVTFTITATGTAKAGDTYRFVYDSLNITPTEFQNRPIEKRYQLSVDCATAEAIETELIAAIGRDPNSLMTVASGGTGVLTMTAKTAGQTVRGYVGQYSVVGQTTYAVTGVNAVTTPAALPVNTYDSLKNINWAKNFNIDTNINYMPLPGAAYTSYYFEVVTTQLGTQRGNNPNVGESTNNQVYAVRLYVNNSSAPTLLAGMNLLEVDLG